MTNAISWFTQHNLTLSKPVETWRMAQCEENCRYTLRGLPHLGYVTPQVTNGVHSFVRLHDGTMFECMFHNVLSERIPVERVQRLNKSGGRPARQSKRLARLLELSKDLGIDDLV